MKGKHRVIVSTKRLKYDFELRRNLTIIRGDSSTGKTTLIDMIREFVNNPSGTPVNLTCDKTCHVLEGALWKEQLSGISDSIVFIDEVSDGTLWEGQIALYFRWTCLPDCAVPELDADYRRNKSRLS